MKRTKITIVGNSVGARIRPPQKSPENKNYGQILEEMLSEAISNLVFDIENLSYHSTLVKSVLDDPESIISKFPHYYIIHLGVVDASTREIPFWYTRCLKKKGGIIKNLLSAVHYHIIMKNRSFFVKLRRYRGWSDIKSFTQNYEALIKLLIKETNARIITLGINVGNERIESILPGSIKNYRLFDEKIQEITERYKQRFIDVKELNSEEHFPDGIHYSLEGHKEIAKRIFNELKPQLNLFDGAFNIN